jgi:hypothetical protein
MLTLRARRVVGDDLIEAGLAYWDRLRGDRVMPARADIDPVAIRHFLPYVMLVDVLRDPLDFRVRLIGSEIERLAPSSPHGHYLSQSRSFHCGSEAWRDYERTVATRGPVAAALHYHTPDRTVRALRHCLMPLSADGITVNMIFNVTAIERF